MTDLSPLASALHSKVWPLVARRALEQCETIDEENAFMNREVPKLAPHLVATPLAILACIWGVHSDEASQWRDDIRVALEAE